ncbi:hypothetical protein Ae201684P_008096, partial [Aphanomyces euteiches]
MSVSVEFENLYFEYVEQFAGINFTQGSVLKNINCQLHLGQRILLVGGNGAGKKYSIEDHRWETLTIERNVLAIGKTRQFPRHHFEPEAYHGCSRLGTRSIAFASHSAAYSADIAVNEMVVVLQQSYPERREELLKVLRIDPEWRMHKLSTGQR